MGSFLTTPKMSPALAARVEASVRGRRHHPGGAAPRMVSLARIGSLSAITLLIGSLVVSHYQEHQALERSRTALLDTVHAQAASLGPEDVAFLARAESWLVRFSGAYEGDLVADDFSVAKAARTILAKPAVYVRGPVAAFATRAGIAEAAAASRKDAFLLCLLDRPVSRAEKVLLSKVRTAYAGGPIVEERTANVRRLGDAVVGLPLLQPPWAARVQQAETAGDLAKLRKELDKAPVEEAKRAAKSSLLVVAMDEPGAGTGPTELDGERPHEVRIALVDLAASKVLLRMRKHVDPTWISMNARAQYASGLDACALALDVHESVP
ncbi:MAG: hypothetical protein ABIP89_08440 [Polyangiaceae bacterium]